jgi:hypothetical protein
LFLVPAFLGSRTCRGTIERSLDRGEVLSQTAEVTGNDARPLVKVYSRARLDRLFGAFDERVIAQRQLTPGKLPPPLRPFRSWLEPHAGWILVVKAVRA